MADSADVKVFGYQAPKSDFRSGLRRAWSPWRRRPLGVIGGLIILLVMFVALSAPHLAAYGPREFAGEPLEKPNASFPLGTNNLGQDVLSRTIYGAQISMAVGFMSAFMGVGIGFLFGLIGGYAGGVADLIIQRVLEVLASFPGFILALVMIAALGQPGDTSQNVFSIIWQLRAMEFAIGVALIFGSTRIIRSAVLTERSTSYVEAAISIGCSPFRIVWRHIAPNVAPYIIVVFTSVIGIVILVEAGLSFLGFGVSVGTPSWGIDLSSRAREYFVQAPWMMIGPGVALSLTVLGFNFFGDALRDILDPRLRGSQ